MCGCLSVDFFFVRCRNCLLTHDSFLSQNSDHLRATQLKIRFITTSFDAPCIKKQNCRRRRWQKCLQHFKLVNSSSCGRLGDNLQRTFAFFKMFFIRAAKITITESIFKFNAVRDRKKDIFELQRYVET